MHDHLQNVDRCVCCGETIPEGRYVCLACAHRTEIPSGTVKKKKKGVWKRILSFLRTENF